MAVRWIREALQRLPLRWVFEVFYLSSSDPWQYWRSEFENRRYDGAMTLLRRHAPPTPTVLEIGCSVGAFSRRLLELAPQRLTALDISSVALRRARQALTAGGGDTVLDLQCVDVFRGDPPGTHDVVIAMDVLGYTDDLEVLGRTRDRLRRALVPGGLLLVGNSKLREHDGEGFEPFASGFPRLGARAILDCVGEGATRVDGVGEEKWRLDLLRV